MFPWWILELFTLQARFPCLNDFVLHCPSFAKSALLDESNEIKQVFLPLLPSRSVSLPFLSLHVGLNLFWHRVVWHITQSMWKLQPPRHSSGCSRNKYFSLSRPGITWDPALLLYIIKLTNVNLKLPISTKVTLRSYSIHSRSWKAY